jgi:L-tartrate/succinate antiporter
MTPMLRNAAPVGVWLGLGLLPTPAGLEPQGWRFFALFAGVVAGLVTEPFPAPVVGLVGVAAATALGYVAPKPADSIAWGLSGFSDGTVWLIFGASVFAKGYESTGLGRRIALTLVKRLGGRTLGLGYAVTLADLLIAPFTPSNTARSAGVIYPIVRNIPGLYGSEPGPTARRIGGYLMWTAFAATTVTSTLFLTALAPNLLASAIIKREVGFDVSWTQWLLGVLPVGLILLASLPILVYAVYPPEVRSSREVPAWASGELARMGRVTAREGLMIALIGLAFALWIFGRDWINATTVGLVVVCLMIILRVLDWEAIASDKAVWGTLVYFATLIALADGLQRVGVVAWVSGAISARLATVPPVAALVALVTFFFVVHYLFASLSAHAAAVLPVVLAAGASVEGMPMKVLAMLAAYSLGLMGVLTPYATGPAAVYFASGFIPRKDFWLLGAVFGLIFLLTLLAVGLPYLLALGV